MSSKLKFIRSDMSKPYLKVIAEKAGGAIHVLDRFHIMQKMNKAIDEVRAAEVKRLKANGYEPVLKRSRWCLFETSREFDIEGDGETLRTNQRVLTPLIFPAIIAGDGVCNLSRI